jgi:hypothetical protein
VTLALAEHHGLDALRQSPVIEPLKVRFLLHHHGALDVRVAGSWDGWCSLSALREVDHGLWEGHIPRPASGTHAYKFLLDGHTWLEDPGNSARVHDGFAGWNSVIIIPAAIDTPTPSNATAYEPESLVATQR